MKISKKILGALVLGIAIQASTSSCNKKDKPEPSNNQANEQPNSNPTNNPDYCPACGMG